MGCPRSWRGVLLRHPPSLPARPWAPSLLSAGGHTCPGTAGPDVHLQRPLRQPGGDPDCRKEPERNQPGASPPGLCGSGVLPSSTEGGRQSRTLRCPPRYRASPTPKAVDMTKQGSGGPESKCDSRVTVAGEPGSPGAGRVHPRGPSPRVAAPPGTPSPAPFPANHDGRSGESTGRPFSSIDVTVQLAHGTHPDGETRRGALL